MKKIVGAVWKLPAKQHRQSSPIWVKMGWIGCAIQQVTSKRLPQFFHIFRIFFLNDFIENPQTRNAPIFLPLNISVVGSVCSFILVYLTIQFQDIQNSFFHCLLYTSSSEGNRKCSENCRSCQFGLQNLIHAMAGTFESISITCNST